MGVDSLIYPEYLAAQEILTALRRPWVRHWFELHDGEIILVGVKMRENAKALVYSLKKRYLFCSDILEGFGIKTCVNK